MIGLRIRNASQNVVVSWTPSYQNITICSEWVRKLLSYYTFLFIILDIDWIYQTQQTHDFIRSFLCSFVKLDIDCDNNFEPTL